MYPCSLSRQNNQRYNFDKQIDLSLVVLVLVDILYIEANHLEQCKILADNEYKRKIQKRQLLVQLDTMNKLNFLNYQRMIQQHREYIQVKQKYLRMSQHCIVHKQLHDFQLQHCQDHNQDSLNCLE
jgi:hypothetical protein